MKNECVDREGLEGIIIDLFNDMDSTYTAIYVSKDVTDIKDTKDIMGKRIFERNLDIKGWLVFIDPIVVANWSHKCEYWFIVNNKTIIKSLDEDWMPDSPEIDKINFNSF